MTNILSDNPWGLLGIVLTLAVGLVALQFAGALLLGIFVYYISLPVYAKLESKLPETIAAGIAPIVFVGPFVLVLAYAVQVVTTEARSAAQQVGLSYELVSSQIGVLNTSATTGLYEAFTEFDIETIQNAPREQIPDVIASNISQSLDIVVGSTSSVVFQLGSLFFTVFLAYALSFYLLREDETIRDFVYSASGYNKNLIAYGRALNSELRVVFFGNILVSVFTAAIGITAYVGLNFFFPEGDVIKYPALLALTCGVTSLIPVIGTKIAYVPAAIVIGVAGLTSGGVASALILPVVFLVVSFITVDTIPDLVVRPYVSSRGETSAALLLFSYTMGPLVFGWYGLFLGPLLFVSLSVYLRTILPRITRS